MCAAQRCLSGHSGTRSWSDDDNVFFLRDARGIDEVQIDTHPHGQTPFYLESDAHPMIETADVAEAVAIVQGWLQGEPTPV